MSNVLGEVTRSGYLIFLRQGVGIPQIALPDNSPAIDLSLTIAQNFVSCWLGCISSDIYTLAVYNLATDRLINFAQDQTGQCYFKDAREKYKINSFIAGVIESSSDEATAQAFAVPESLKSLQLSDLQNLKTPYGRAYLEFAQQLGTLWGLS